MKYLKRQPKVFYFKQDTISSDKKWIVQVKHGSHIIRQDRHAISVNGQPLVKNEANSDSSPTCEKMLALGNMDRKEVHIAETELYRQVMNEEYSTYGALLYACEPLFKLFKSGYYQVEVKHLIPTDGAGNWFQELPTDSQNFPASVDLFYRQEGNEPFAYESEPAFLVPTQSKDSLEPQTILEYKEKSFMGRGFATHFVGFYACLLDGHHKATAAFQKREWLECVVVSTIREVNKKRLQPINLDELISVPKAMPQLHDLPTLQEYCHLMDFSKKHTEKICVSTDFAQLDENEITHLIDFTYFTAPAEYLELYPVLAIDPYRIHLDHYLSKLLNMQKHEEEREAILLDYLIQDDGKNPKLTKKCVHYFR